MSSANWWRPTALHWTRTGVLVAAIFGLLGLLAAGGGPSSPRASGTGTQPFQVQPAPAAQPPQLDLSAAVDSRCPTWGTDDGWDSGEYQVGGTIISDALLCSMWNAKQDADDWAIREYLVPTGTKYLQATLGLADETESTELRLQIAVMDPVTGKVYHKGTATYGHPIQVRAAVEDTIRISFRAKLIDSSDEDHYAHFVLWNVVLS